MLRSKLESSLRGRVVVVTGAASGIGRALTRELAAHGARVAMLDIDAEKLDDMLDQVPHGQAMTRLCDVRDSDACELALRSVIEQWGGIDVLINNAGVSHHSTFVNTDADVLRRVMDINFYGAVHCTRSAISSLLERRGMIVVLSSVAGFAPLVGRCGYAASKHALHGFFDSLRAELVGTGVDVLMVCPSFVRTSIDANSMAGNGARIGSTTLHKGSRALDPDEVASDIVRGIVRRRRQLVISSLGKSSYWLWHFAPSVYQRLMRWSQRHELGRSANA